MMKNFKQSVVIVSAMIIFPLFVSGCSLGIKKEKTVGDVEKHFRNSGLRVEDVPAVSGEEKEFVEDFQDVAKSMGIGEKSNVAESKNYMVESVKINILKYKDAESAQKAYDYFIGFEERKKKRSEKKPSPYFQTSYFLNKPFLLLVRHYKAKLVTGGLGADKIDISEEKLQKIRKSFAEFK